MQVRRKRRFDLDNAQPDSFLKPFEGSSFPLLFAFGTFKGCTTQECICTDGLSDALLDDEIETLLKENALAQAGNELVAEANRRGGLDNITIAQIQIVEAP